MVKRARRRLQHGRIRQPAGDCLADLFAKGDAFSPGAIVYIDVGTYNLTKNVVLTSAYSSLTFQCPTTRADASVTPGTTTAGFWDLDINCARNVRFENLALTGAAYGLFLDDKSGTTGIVFDNGVATANGTNIYVGVGDNNFSLTNSTISAQAAGSGDTVGNASGVTIAEDAINVGQNRSFGGDPGNASSAIVQSNVFTGPDN